MSQPIQTPPVPRRSVPLWAQILIWTGLLAFLAFLAIGLMRAQVPMIKINSEVPDFTLTFFEGYGYNGAEQIQFSEFRGKVVLINFWASWCPPCKEEAALLESAWRLYQPDGEVIFLGIDYLDAPNNGSTYLSEYDITYPNSPDLQESISRRFNRDMGVPETYFIDRQGVLRAFKIGPFESLSQITAIIDPLVAEK